MFALDFVLNFTADASRAIKAAQGFNNGISSMLSSTEMLQKNIESVFGTMEEGALNNLWFQMREHFGNLGYNAREASAMTRLWAAESATAIGSINENFSRLAPIVAENVETMEKMRSTLGDISKTDIKGVQTFNEQLSKMNDLMGEMSTGEQLAWAERLEDFPEQLESSTEALYDMNRALEDQNRILALRAGWKNFRQNTLGLIRSAAGLTSGLAILTDVVREQDVVATAAAQHGMAQLNVSMVNGRRNIESLNTSFEEMGGHMRSVRRATNILGESTRRAAINTSSSFRDANESMVALLSNRTLIQSNIHETQQLTETVLNMQHAFGLSAGAAAEMARSIMVIGGGSVQDLNRAMDALANVQAQMGLSAEEAQAVANQVGVMTRQFRAFGASTDQVDKVTEGVAELVATFKNVGLEASEANKILNDMLDPSRMETNVMMWQGLGMSASQGMEMMMRGGEGLEDINERMVGLAKNLRNQYGGNIFALQAMAEAHGMSVQQVMALSDETRALTRAEEREADLQQAADAARASMLKTLQKLWNQIAVAIHGVIFPAITALTPILGGIANIVRGISQFFNWIADKVPVIGDALAFIGKVALALILGRMLGIVPKFRTMFTLVKGLPGLLGKLPGLLGAAGAKLGGLVKGAGSLKDRFVGLFKAAPTGGVGGAGGAGAAGAGMGAATENLGGTERAAGGVNKLGEAFKNFPKPRQLLALAVAILAIGAAVSGIVLSFTQLAKAMESFSWQEMLAFAAVTLAIMIPLMWGLVAAIGAMGAIGAAAAPGLLAAAVAILAIGAAVAIIVLSMAVLVNSIANLVQTISETGNVAGPLLATMGALAVGLLAVGMAGMMAAPGLMIASVAMLALGAGAMMAGVGIMLISAGVTMIINAITQLLTFIAESNEMFAGLTLIIAQLAVALLTLAPAALRALPGLLALAAGIAAIGAVMLIFGGRIMMLGISFALLGSGIQKIAEHTETAKIALLDFINTFKNQRFAGEFIQQIDQIARAMTRLALMMPIVGIFAKILGIDGEEVGGAGASGGDNIMGEKLNQVVTEIQQSNIHLSAIEGYTKRTTELLEKVSEGKERLSVEFGAV